jgi:hypothetical protein
MLIGKNYTGKIHAIYSTSSANNAVGRAACSQAIVVNSIDAPAIHSANETQFCGKCFSAKRHGTRKANALAIHEPA